MNRTQATTEAEAMAARDHMDTVVVRAEDHGTENYFAMSASDPRVSANGIEIVLQFPHDCLNCPNNEGV